MVIMTILVFLPLIEHICPDFSRLALDLHLVVAKMFCLLVLRFTSKCMEPLAKEFYDILRIAQEDILWDMPTIPPEAVTLVPLFLQPVPHVGLRRVLLGYTGAQLKLIAGR